MKKRILVCLLALVMLIGVMPVAMAAEAEETGPDGYKWIVSKSKEATALDANKESTITLSLPSAEEALVSDVVFVLDESDCSDAVLAQMTGLLGELQTAAKASNASINVGVAFFRGIAVEAYPLTAYTGDNTAITNAIKDANANMVLKGTNLPAGLLVAQNMLSKSSTSPMRQYMILVSDGATYLYTHDNDPTTHYSRTSGLANMDGGLYEWVAKYDKTNPNSGKYLFPNSFQNNGDKTDWEAFLADIAEKRDSFISSDQEYVRTSAKPIAGLTHPDPIYTAETIDNFVINVEESMYQAATTYKQIAASKVNCYTVAVNTNMGVFSSFANYLANLGKGSGMNFSTIKNDILYAVGAGSTVVDKMGSEFKFGGLETVTLKIGTETLTNGTISGNTITFAHDGNATAHVITYDPAEDAFTWTINENVSNFAPVQLSYKVQLDKPSTVPGDHKVPTNEYAKLTPKDSSGKDGTVQEFEKPEITYTVDEQGNVVPGVEIFLPAFALTYDDHYSYLIGYSDGTVRPNGKITRAEVATIFFRLLDDDTRAKYWSSENDFSDVSADKWYNNAVSTLSHMGVIGGYADGTFRPDAPISRAEFAKIAVSFTQNNGSAVYNYFTDVKATDWFAPYVTAAKDAGLIEGYSDGSFKPENKITRAEACAIVNRTLGRKPSKAHMKISDRIDWPDVQTTDWFYEAIMEATNSHTYQMGKRVETWNDKLPQRDWTALETGWANAYTGNGGEVR